MFNNLLQFWKGKDFLTQVLEDFKSMLDDAETMFTSVCRKLIDNKEEPGLRDKIYEIDKNVNSLEKDIRKRIVEHLALQPSYDVSTSLLLMSVVKDAERLGDYAKNLLEVTELLDKPIDKERYLGIFDNIEDEILELFKYTKKAFIESDQAQAIKTWSRKRDVSNKCDEILKKLAKSSLSVNEAVCFTLMARHFKRLASHLTNIATSVILPLTDLDYFDERRKEA
ncbi:MAG: PhoU domain-containing protein [Candidatus Omnitrophota bacterium]